MNVGSLRQIFETVVHVEDIDKGVYFAHLVRYIINFSTQFVIDLQLCQPLMWRTEHAQYNHRCGELSMHSKQSRFYSYLQVWLFQWF